MNSSNPTGRYDKLVVEIAQALTEAKQEVERTREQYDRAKHEAQGLTTALRALAPDHQLVEAAAKAQKPKKSSYSSRIQPAYMEQLWKWIQEADHMNQPITVSAAAKALPFSDDVVRRGIYALRDGEALRLTGKARGEHGHPIQVFKLMSVEAGERMIEENEEKFPAHVAKRLENS